MQGFYRANSFVSQLLHHVIENQVYWGLFWKTTAPSSTQRCPSPSLHQHAFPFMSFCSSRTEMWVWDPPAWRLSLQAWQRLLSALELNCSLGMCRPLNVKSKCLSPVQLEGQREHIKCLSWLFHCFLFVFQLLIFLKRHQTLRFSIDLPCCCHSSWQGATLSYSGADCCPVCPASSTALCTASCGVINFSLAWEKMTILQSSFTFQLPLSLHYYPCQGGYVTAGICKIFCTVFQWNFL